MSSPLQDVQVRGASGMRLPARPPRETGWPGWSGEASFLVLLWLGLWASINTGPWVLARPPNAMSEYYTYARAATPLVVLAVLIPFATRLRFAADVPPPLKWWLGYAAIGLVGCLRSPRPFDSAYWIAAYVAVIGVALVFLRSGAALCRATQLNHLTWLTTTAFLGALIFFARDALFVESDTGLTGYGIVNRVRDVPMARASGFARFAAVPGVVAFAAAWGATRLARTTAILVALGSATMVYLMQSRGAIVALAASMLLVFYLFAYRTRFLVVLLVILGLLAAASDSVPQSVIDHLTRKQSAEDLASMTGRTRAWNNALDKLPDSPLYGFGAQADRWLIHEHVHNTYLYALLQSGLIGAAMFVGGLVWTWRSLLQLIHLRISGPPGSRLMLMQVTGILAFFTIRSIPEVSGAMFGVDLLVMVPAMVYVAALHRHYQILRFAGLPYVLGRHPTKVPGLTSHGEG